jgi:hypothetical protein
MPGPLVTPLAYTYLVQGDLERQMGVYGLKVRLDQNADGYITTDEQAIVQDIINEATETVNFYCWGKYTDAMLATSNWVNRKATILGVYRACTIRLNPVPDFVVEDSAKVEEELKTVRDGAGLIPFLPLRRALAPKWSNTRVVVWPFEFRCIRVERCNSSQQAPSPLNKFTDWYEAYAGDRL